MDRLIILFLPSFFGLLWEDSPRFSIAWSLAGSLFIAWVSHTGWFRESGEDVPVTHRLLRPLSMYQFYFLGLNVMGATFFALDAAGYNFHGQVAEPNESLLALVAQVQRYMLLGHASVIAGMKLVGFRYDRPKYLIPSIPPYSLIVISFVCLGVGSVGRTIPGLLNLGYKLVDIASTAILVETWLSVRRGYFANRALTLGLLGFNLATQLLSGWKALALWTMFTLGALFYPLMPKKVAIGGTALVLFWMLYLHPFGQAMRELTWTGSVDRNLAAEMAWDYSVSLSLEDRLDNTWLTMVTRTNEVWQFEKYVQYVPDRRPHYGFELVTESMIALIPRVLWPEKPDLEKLVMQRVIEAGVIMEESQVSAKTSFYVDGYLSGGWPVILVACLFYGMVGMIVNRVCERFFGGYDIGTCFIYVGLFAYWINTGPGFLFFVGAIWTSFLVMFGFFVACRMMGWIVPMPPLKRVPADEVGLSRGQLLPHTLQRFK